MGVNQSRGRKEMLHSALRPQLTVEHSVLDVHQSKDGLCSVASCQGLGLYP